MKDLKDRFGKLNINHTIERLLHMVVILLYVNQTFNSYYHRMKRFLESPVNIMVDKRVCEKIKFLEEENKRLKSDLSLVIKERDDNIEQNKKLKEENSYRAKVVDIIPQDEKSIAEETIKDLQERIRFLEQCLDNKEKVNKSLREENDKLRLKNIHLEMSEERKVTITNISSAES